MGGGGVRRGRHAPREHVPASKAAHHRGLLFGKGEGGLALPTASAIAAGTGWLRLRDSYRIPSISSFVLQPYKEYRTGVRIELKQNRGEINKVETSVSGKPIYEQGRCNKSCYSANMFLCAVQVQFFCFGQTQRTAQQCDNSVSQNTRHDLMVHPLQTRRIRAGVRTMPGPNLPRAHTCEQ